MEIKSDTKQDILMNSLTEFFIKEKNLDNMMNIVGQNSEISLRLLDWFVTNYSKKFPVNCNKGIDVYQDYQNQLKAFQKKNFDPFCRIYKKQSISFTYNTKGDTVQTTVGQLNFFRWAISNKILEHVKEHAKEIEEDMNKSIFIKKQNKKKNEQITLKSKESSITATRKCTKRYTKIIVSFN